jgi:arsenate reductase
MIRVLFLDTHGFCRAQMAAWLTNHFLRDRVHASAAAADAAPVDPRLIAVLSEIGIAVTDCMTKAEEDFAEETFDYVITLLGDAGEKCLLHGATSYCGRCNAVCPHLQQTSHGGRRVYLTGVLDPSRSLGSDDEIREAYRKARDEIKDVLVRFFREVSLDKP